MKLLIKLILALSVFTAPVLIANEKTQFDSFVAAIKEQKDKEMLAQEGARLLESELDDSQRAYVLHRVALLHNKLGDFTKVENYLNQLEGLLTQFKSSEYQGKLFITRGDLAINLGQFITAQRNFEQAIKFFEKTKDHRMLSHSLRFYSFALKESGKFSEAMRAVERAKIAATMANNTPVTMAAYNAEAMIYSDLKLPVKALEIQLDLLDYVTNQAESPENWYGQLYYSIGKSYADLKDHEKSLDAYLNAYKYDKKTQFFNYVGSDLIKISQQLMALERYAEVPVFLEEALTLFTELKSERNIAWTKGNQAELLTYTQQYAEAILLFEEALESLDKIESKVLHQQLSLSYAKALVGNNDHIKALKILNKLNTSGVTQSSQHTLTNLLATVYSQLGRFEEAFAMKNMAYNNLTDEMNNESNSRALGLAAQAQYQTSQIELAEMKAEQEVNEIKNQQNMFIAAGVALILLLSFIGLYLLYRQKRKLAQQEATILNKSLMMKDQLLADVSHELRTPLTVLKLNIESLEHNLIDDPDATYKLLHVRLDSLNKLISDIYELAQADSGYLELQRVQCDAYELVSNFSNDIELLVTKAGLSFESKVNIQLNALVSIDVHKLNQVIYNLARNSINYTDLPGKVEFSSEIINNDLILCLSDSSPSVSVNDLDKIFDRLYRCDKSRSRESGGSGLGLAISKKIISLHGGTIKASLSELGGVSVLITVPLYLNK